MYFTEDSLKPENQAPLIICAAPYGPSWLPGDASDLPVSFDDQTQSAVDCYNAGATMLHIHVRDPKTGHGSVDMDDFQEMLGRLRKAVPKMILSVGGSISFAPKGPGQKAAWLGYDTRHMLADLKPTPDQVTLTPGTTSFNITEMLTPDEYEGTSFKEPGMLNAYSELTVEATPSFYVEHLKRLRKNNIQPYFMNGHIHMLETVERLIRHGHYMGPLNHCLMAVGGGCAGRNPFDMMEYIRRSPQGSVFTMMSNMRSVFPLTTMAIALGVHVRSGIEENLWSPTKSQRMTTVKQVEWQAEMAGRLGRKVATAEEAREVFKIGTWYNSVAETLANLGLPPNREDHQRGFLVKETDGKAYELSSDDIGGRSPKGWAG